MNRSLQLVNHLKLQPGDRVVVAKSLFGLIQHHAIYVGSNNHDYWIIENKEGYGVRVITVAEFLAGVDKVTRIEPFTPRYNYSREDLVAYAYSKVGTTYHLTKYNCESFANEVQHRVIKSNQADVGLGLAVVGGLLLAAGLLSNGRSK